ncbi:MAG: DUF192 domain-containing protein [Nitrospiria bacterium]
MGFFFYSCTNVNGQPIQFPSGTTIHAEVVDTPEKREQGLMFREHLPEGGGMLFVFQKAKPYQFWMKNCKFPIDIIWLSKTKKIIYISEKTPPCQADPCPLYGPKKQNALYVLEVASGFSKREGLSQGIKIQF